MIETVQGIMATRTSGEWMALFEAAGTQAMRVLEPAEALADPHNAARGMTPVYTAPDGETVAHIGCPIKLSDTPPAFRHVGHTPGQDDAAVRAKLGL